MAKKVSSSYSKTGASGVNNQKNTSKYKNKQTQTNKSTATVNNNSFSDTISDSIRDTNRVSTSDSTRVSTSDSTRDSSSTTTGIQNTVSYKDLTGLSPQTIALQNRVYNNTGYTPSQEVKNAYGQKQNAENAVANYGAYNSDYQDVIQQTLDKILNRTPFNYDFNADALYRSYADQYAMQGKQAAQNAAASASALTGGYGNSYATSVAAQANQQYMSELNDKIPELYQLAMERYNQETNNLMNQFSMLGAQDDREYGRYNDEKQYLMSDRDYYNSNYASERQADMTNQQNAYENALNLLNYRTNLEVKDVTNNTNRSDVTSRDVTHDVTNDVTHDVTNDVTHEVAHDESHTKSGEKNITKNNSTDITKQNSTSKDTSKQNTSNTSVTSSSTSASGSSGGTKGNNLTGTSTSYSTISNVMSEFKSKLKANSDPSKTTGYKSSPQLAKEYLAECVENGTIKSEDFDYIMRVCGVKA